MQVIGTNRYLTLCTYFTYLVWKIWFTCFLSYFPFRSKPKFNSKARMRILNPSRSFRVSVSLSTRFSAHSRRYASTKISDPLHILFCGSDEFSVASLRALHEEHRRNPNFIASIDVVCRPAKRVGRNLKEFRERNKPFIHIKGVDIDN